MIEIVSKPVLKELIYDAEPVENLHRNSDTYDKMFQKIMELTSWHQHYKINRKTPKSRYQIERKILTKLLGKPSFTGKKLSDDTEFFITQSIWGCLYDDLFFVIYLSEEGLSIEIDSETTKDDTHKILDIFMKTILPQQKPLYE